MAGARPTVEGMPSVAYGSTEQMYGMPCGRCSHLVWMLLIQAMTVA